MDFVGNSYNGYLERSRRGIQRLLVRPWVQCYHGTCKTAQLKDFVAFSIILSKIEFLVQI